MLDHKTRVSWKKERVVGNNTIQQMAELRKGKKRKKKRKEKREPTTTTTKAGRGA